MFTLFLKLLFPFTLCCALLFPIGANAATSYAELRSLQGSAGQTATLTAERIGGTFAFASVDPKGQGDNNGIVIKAPNGWWVRQFSHSRQDPIQFDWFQVKDGQAVSGLMISLARAYSPRLYIKMPSQPMTLHHNSGPVRWTSDYGITEFALLESDSQTAIKVDNTDAQAVWEFGDMRVLIIGSDAVRSSRNDYRFTLIGPWTWTNRGVTDASSFVASVGMVAVFHDTWSTLNDAPSFYFRFNTKFPLSCSLYVGGNGARKVYISGTHRYGGCLSTGGQYSGLVHFEDAYVSDELGRGPGWKGTTDGAVDRSLGHWRGTVSTQVANGSLKAEILQVTGKLTVQYGSAEAGFFFVDKFGTSQNEPLIINVMDHGWTGPNELNKPAGVALDRSVANDHPIKSDGLGEEQPGWRYLYVIESNQWGKNPEWHDRIWFAENAQCDDVPNCAGTYTTQTTWTYANAAGDHYYENGDHVDDRIEGNVIQGDGVHPAFTAGWAVLVARDTARYGRFHNISVDTVQDEGPPFFASGSGNKILNVTLTGKLELMPSSVSNDATNLTFLGSAREVITLGSGSGLKVTNVCAPSGSTIGGSGKAEVSGVVVQLPYRIKTTDCAVANPDIPGNPTVTFGSAPNPAPNPEMSPPANLRVQ